jgi:hypothetical protein
LRVLSGPDALAKVLRARAWQEKSCRHHELCRLFDTYTLAGYLGGKIEEAHPVDRAVLIDVEAA